MQLKLLQECNHKVLVNTMKYTTIEINRGYRNYIPTGTMIDQITSVSNVIAVDRIYQENIYNNSTLSPELYNLYNNRIIWLKEYDALASSIYRVPNAGEFYFAVLKHQESTLQSYSPEECDRCHGKGWYFNTISCNNSISKLSGPITVAQEYLKCLLTVPGSNRLDESYGAGLSPYSGVLYLTSDSVDEIRTAVKTAEYQCKNSSLNDSRDGYEILDNVTIDMIETDPVQGGASIDLTLYTVNGSKVRFNLAE